MYNTVTIELNIVFLRLLSLNLFVTSLSEELSSYRLKVVNIIESKGEETEGRTHRIVELITPCSAHRAL